MSQNPPESALETRSRRSEIWIIVGWALIAVKSVLTWWLIKTYHVPIHPLWIIGPTVMFGALCTAVYIWRN